MESTHIIKHPEYVKEKELKPEKNRAGHRRNDICLIKMEHNEETRNKITSDFFPDIPCRLKKADQKQVRK